MWTCLNLAGLFAPLLVIWHLWSLWTRPETERATYIQDVHNSLQRIQAHLAPFALKVL